MKFACVPLKATHELSETHLWTRTGDNPSLVPCFSPELRVTYKCEAQQRQSWWNATWTRLSNNSIYIHAHAFTHTVSIKYIGKAYFLLPSPNGNTSVLSLLLCWEVFTKCLFLLQILGHTLVLWWVFILFSTSPFSSQAPLPISCLDHLWHTGLIRIAHIFISAESFSWVGADSTRNS